MDLLADPFNKGKGVEAGTANSRAYRLLDVRSYWFVPLVGAGGVGLELMALPKGVLRISR
jgi:hypothetical protein